MCPLLKLSATFKNLQKVLIVFKSAQHLYLFRLLCIVSSHPHHTAFGRKPPAARLSFLFFRGTPAEPSKKNALAEVFARA